MKYDIRFNSQRDNFSFNGKFKGWSQCFSTSVWMLMSYFCKDIVANDDKYLSKYVDDVESTVGKPGIAEKVVRKFKWITGKTSLWWLVQKEGLEKWMWDRGVKGNAIFSDCENDFGDLPSLLKHGPVILGTKKIGGLKGGHIILIIGYENNCMFICNDPYGDAGTDYKIHNGEGVLYSYSWLKKYAVMNKQGKIRCMYWKKL